MSHDGLAKLSFTLPNGVIISACNLINDDWESIDIRAEFPDRTFETVCAVECEKSEGKLRVFVYGRESDDPIYEQRDYFGLSEAAINAINARISDLQFQLENSMYADRNEEIRMVEEKAELIDTLRLAGIAKEEIPV